MLQTYIHRPIKRVLYVIPNADPVISTFSLIPSRIISNKIDERNVMAVLLFVFLT